MRRLFLLTALLLAGCQTDKVVLGAGDNVSELVSVGGLLGPTKAKGVVLYLHGSLSNGTHGRDLHFPRIVEDFGGASFDLYRLNLGPQDDNRDGTLRETSAALKQMRTLGYRFVVVAGHSAGGTMALLAAGQLGGADAAVVFASGWDARESLGRQSDIMRALISELRPNIRVAAFYFTDDEVITYWKEMAALMSAELAKRNQPSFVIVPQMQNTKGHGGVASYGFADRYSKCLVEFVTAAKANPNVCAD
jgi:pimeloyl-ACP methyl ester carboxylesterase